MQLAFHFDTVHRKENNSTSQANLNLRREDFNEDCWKCLKAMMNRERLTSKGAMNSGLSGHLARRIKDIQDDFKIVIDRTWIYVTNENGKKKKSHLEYFMTDAEIQRTQRRIINLLN